MSRARYMQARHVSVGHVIDGEQVVGVSDDMRAGLVVLQMRSGRLIRCMRDHELVVS